MRDPIIEFTQHAVNKGAIVNVSIDFDQWHGCGQVLAQCGVERGQCLRIVHGLPQPVPLLDTVQGHDQASRRARLAQAFSDKACGGTTLVSGRGDRGNQAIVGMKRATGERRR